MNLALLQSSLVKKYVMAITGFLLFGFVVGHMLGNLQIFMGPDQINTYAHFLQSKPFMVWAARLGLLLLLGLHIGVAIKLSVENKAARPVPYSCYEPVAASYASRTMLMSGLIVTAFILYHLLHFTVQIKAINLTGEDFRVIETALPGGAKCHDVYRMMVIGFSNAWVSLFYLVGVGLLSLHLSHGLSSLFQSVGWRNQRYGAWIDRAAVIAAIVLFAGYASIPLAVLTRIVK